MLVFVFVFKCLHVCVFVFVCCSLYLYLHLYLCICICVCCCVLYVSIYQDRQVPVTIGFAFLLFFVLLNLFFLIFVEYEIVKKPIYVGFCFIHVCFVYSCLFISFMFVLFKVVLKIPQLFLFDIHFLNCFSFVR